MPEKILRCAIYIRVSTFEQSVHGKSLQAQKECLEQYATDNNMSIVGVYAYCSRHSFCACRERMPGKG